MLGFNGGLLGKRRVPTISEAKGLWFPNEQSVAKRAAIWPASPGDLILVGSITYSQSSVYSGVSAADNASMTDGSFNNDRTATNSTLDLDWIKMDLGAVYPVDRVIVGTGTSSIPGGWSWDYTDNLDIEYSTDDATWTNAGNTSNITGNGIYTYNVSFSARYIRLSSTGWVVASEFYALSPGQTYP